MPQTMLDGVGHRRGLTAVDEPVIQADRQRQYGARRVLRSRVRAGSEVLDSGAERRS